MIGWVKLHRKMINWEWYDDIPVKVLFIHLILTANLEPEPWKGQSIKRGELITSLKRLSAETGLSEKQIRRALKVLKKSKEICYEGTKWTHVTICKFNAYQDKENKQGTEREPKRAPEGNPKGQQLKNKRSKEDKNKTSVKNKFLQEREILNFVKDYFDLDLIQNLTQADKNNWLETINKLHRLDGYDYDTIKNVIIWGRQDDFWKSNFLSVASLRKKRQGVTKFQQILKKMQYGTENQRNNQQMETARYLSEKVANDDRLAD